MRFRPNNIRSCEGMTLVEVMIALGIAAGITAFIVGAIGERSDSELKRLAGQIMRTVKYAYMQAATSNGYFRLGFDLSAEPQVIVLESSDKPFYIVKTSDEKEALRKKNEERLVGEEEGSVTAAAGTGDFAETEDDLVPRIEVSADIKVQDIRTEHDPEPVADGKTHLYFFPKGYTEFAVIHISDVEETNFITLMVNPLTGEIEVVEDYVDYDDALQSQGLPEEE